MTDGEPREDLASLSSILKIRDEDMANRVKKKEKRKGSLLIHGHVGLDQADREERERGRNHPATGSTTTIPVRWNTAGGKIPQPRDIENK